MQSRKTAFCGVLAALSVLLMLLGSALQVGTYAAPMLAAFLQIPVLEEYGPRWAMLLYAAAAVLALLLVPETELALFYLLAVGYFPALRGGLERVRPAVLRWGLKLLAFNSGTALVYLLLFALLGPAVGRELLQDGPGMLALLLVLGNVSFALYDRALAVLTRCYRTVWRKRLKFFH